MKASEQMVTVIIPAKNERACLEPVLSEIPKDVVSEILVVDGHSTDGTPDLVRSLGHKVITQEGVGFGCALDTGLKHMKGDLFVIYDADGSYNPSALSVMKKKIDEGYDVVFCSRYLPASGKSLDDTWIRAFGNWFFTTLMRVLFHVRLSDSLFLYCMAKKEVLHKVKMTSKSFEWCIEFPIKVEQAGFKYCEIPSQERARIAGNSKVNAFYHGLEILWFLIQYRIKSIFPTYQRLRNSATRSQT